MAFISSVAMSCSKADGGAEVGLSTKNGAPDDCVSAR
jgi:hypothetical protein